MFKLPTLPFDMNAFESLISPMTIDAHYNGHHRAYVQKLNELIKGTIFERGSLNEIIKFTGSNLQDPKLQAIYNNACQHLLHSTYWKMFNPEWKSTKSIMDEDLIDCAMHSFGSGWIWMDEAGSIGFIPNTGPLPEGCIWLIDMWEHAYYLDYEYKREDAVRAFLDIMMPLQ